MNTLPDILHCMSSATNGTEMSVFERQRARMKWQQDHNHQQQMSSFSGNEVNVYCTTEPQAQAQAPGFEVMSSDIGFDSFLNCVVKPDPGMDNGWPDLGKFGGDSEYYGYGNANANVNELSCAISRTFSCPPVVPAAIAQASGDNSNEKKPVFPEKKNSAGGRESFKKRKADKALAQKVGHTHTHTQKLL